MALDEPNDCDAVFDINGITYLIAKDFFDQIKPIKVDYTNSLEGAEFSISSVAYRFKLRALLQNRDLH
jgi:Fe-S cluster assembly iron-binding protein IscA